MLFRPRLLRCRSRRYQRVLFWTLLVCLVLDACSIVLSRPVTVRVAVAGKAEEQGKDAGASIHAGSSSSRSSSNSSLYIVSVHRNTEAILRAAWIPNLLRLIDHLGPANVYVSAVESGSQDGTKAALLDLQTALRARGVDHSIDLGATVWQQLDELSSWPAPDSPEKDRAGWIWHAEEGHYALRRIPYLARVRNQAMAPLLAEAQRGRRFDRVLWINDVAFDTADVLTLLNTRGGRYAAACAMDFKTYPFYYDTFALRDAHGDKTASDQWPWFRAAAARADVRAGRPVRVQSCWNGMVVFDARPFYGEDHHQHDDQQATTTATTPPPPLVFRGVDDSLAALHLEASECCLIHADNPLAAAPSSAGGGVWLNPNVRVAYSVPVYQQVRGGGGGDDEDKGGAAGGTTRRFPGAAGAGTERAGRGVPDQRDADYVAERMEAPVTVFVVVALLSFSVLVVWPSTRAQRKHPPQKSNVVKKSDPPEL
ncbi:polysaccharide export protein [Niveomyces insectorum RCEF 264]|uniref:Polysaccharide export protein n=1 Tax=Niveomyces insectorum RCEF 264 TaxID=1081102 RepID=A0A167TUW5_9HYPO|nr:polysaccharide export protein [Niveomyces insectorum RCEF 264]